MIKDTNIRVQITFEKEVLKKLKELAKNDDRTVSNYLNNLIKNIEEV